MSSNQERVKKVKEALKNTGTTFTPAQSSTTDHLKQLQEIANTVGLYDAADWLQARLQEPKLPRGFNQ